MKVPGLCGCEDRMEKGGSLTEERSQTDLTVLRRGNRNKLEFLRAKMEDLRERRTTG